MKNKRIAHGFAMLVMIIWGLSYLSIKVVVAEVEPTLSAFYRFFIASVILFVFLKAKYPEEKVLKEDRFKMLLGGLFGVTLYFFFENYSVLYTSASNVSILISSIPVFTIILQGIVFKERLTFSKVLGTMLSVIGIAVIVMSKERVSLFSTGTLGDLMALGAAISWVVYNLLTRSFKGNYKSITITTYQGICGTVLLSPVLFFNKLKVPSIAASMNLLYLAIFCSCIGYILYIYCLEHLGATVVTTYINLQPIISITAAFFIIGEKITLWQALGSGIIILGVFMVSLDRKPRLQSVQEVD